MKTQETVSPLIKASRMAIGIEQIVWGASKADSKVIAKIVDRAMTFDVKGYDAMTCNMDLTACHLNGNPLKLAELLAADDFNFTHDVFGIARHIDRETGQLKNCFSPRFSQLS
jgi:hypothetical protein